MNSPDSRQRSLPGRMILRGLPLMFMIALSAASASAQYVHSSSSYGNTPLGMEQGAPAGSYPLSGFESVNPYNGALNFRLPLLKIGGRGSVQHVISLAVEHHWSVDKDQSGGPNAFNYSPQPNRWTTFYPGFSPHEIPSFGSPTITRTGRPARRRKPNTTITVTAAPYYEQ